MARQIPDAGRELRREERRRTVRELEVDALVLAARGIGFEPRAAKMDLIHVHVIVVDRGAAEAVVDQVDRDELPHAGAVQPVELRRIRSGIAAHVSFGAAAE